MDLKQVFNGTKNAVNELKNYKPEVNTPAFLACVIGKDYLDMIQYKTVNMDGSFTDTIKSQQDIISDLLTEYAKNLSYDNENVNAITLRKIEYKLDIGLLTDTEKTSLENTIKNGMNKSEELYSKAAESIKKNDYETGIKNYTKYILEIANAANTKMNLMNDAIRKEAIKGNMPNESNNLLKELMNMLKLKEVPFYGL
jgi:hypothetical protein